MQRPALVVGLASVVSVEAGVQIATSVPEHVLRRLFGLLLIGIAAQLAWKAAAAGRRYPESS